MGKSKFVNANKKIEEKVVGTFKEIENTVVSGYTKIEDSFVDRYLTKEGETVEEAIFREVKEEIGIEIPKKQIKVIDVYKSNDKNKRFAYNFIFVVNYKIDDYILQKEEVAEVKYVTIEEMELAKKNNDLNYTFCNWSDEDFYREMDLLKNKRKEILDNKIL